MLPGLIPFHGGKPPVYNGLDPDTVSMMKFDEYSYNTVLASKTFKDSAKSGRVWTASSSSTQVASTGKFAGGSGIYCDGSGYSSAASESDYTNALLTAGDFTIDLWILPNGAAVGFNGAILGKPNPATWYGPWLIYQSGGAATLYASSNGTSWDVAAGVNIGGMSTSAWNHVAFERYGSTWSTYLNGTRVSQFTNGATLMQTTDPVRITYSAATWGGYLDEIRFSKVARYKGAASFTPPDAPYYGVLNGLNDDATKVLLHLDGAGTAYVDSAKGKNNSVRVPVAQGAANQLGSAGKIGIGCVSCGAVTDGINLGTVGAQDWWVGNSGSYTIDWWWYRISNTAGDVLTIRDNTSQTSPLMIYDTGSGVLNGYISFGGSAWDVGPMALGTVPLNQWTHLAFVFDRSTQIIRFFINGTQTYSLGSAAGYYSAGVNLPLRLGSQSDGLGAAGYYDELRFSNVARWKAGFMVPTVPYAPDLPDAATKVLMHFDGNLNDESMTPHAFGTGGTVGLNTSGGAFNGYANIAVNGFVYSTASGGSPDFEFGASDFTIEWYDWFFSLAGGGAVLARDPNLAYSPWVFGYNGGTGRFLCYGTSSGSAWDMFANVDCGSMAVGGPWSHRAISRQGNTIRFFQSGSLVSSITTSLGFLASSSSLFINRYASASPSNIGIDELRISKGIARYTAAFTPPPAPFAPP